jgi:hypothetical protein
LNLLLHFPCIVNLLENSSMKQNLLQVIERMTLITESNLSLSKFFYVNDFISGAFGM